LKAGLRRRSHHACPGGSRAHRAPIAGRHPLFGVAEPERWPLRWHCATREWHARFAKFPSDNQGLPKCLCVFTLAARFGVTSPRSCSLRPRTSSLAIRFRSFSSCSAPSTWSSTPREQPGPPDSKFLRVVLVIPARSETSSAESCLRSLARRTRSPSSLRSNALLGSRDLLGIVLLIMINIIYNISRQ
jgi:hypothetical protein